MVFTVNFYLSAQIKRSSYKICVLNLLLTHNDQTCPIHLTFHTFQSAKSAGIIYCPLITQMMQIYANRS
jgi:hypothetical protein